MKLERLFKNYQKCFDRFTFDELFRIFLLDGFSHDEAKELILYNCTLSSVIFQERIENESYRNINSDITISEDLQKMKNDIFISLLRENSLN